MTQLPHLDTQASSTSHPREESGVDHASAPSQDFATDFAGARDEQLRQTAHELFAANGLGVPLADVAKAAGVGVATLYRRYKDKDILILDVYRQHMAAGERFALTANGYEDSWAGIEYFLRRSTDQLLRDRGMRELVLGGYIGGAGWARGSTHKELIAALDEMEAKVTAQLKVLVASAKAAKSVREDFEHHDLLLISAMAQAALPVDHRGATAVGQRALQLLIEGIRPAPEQPL
ncbi:hypothetical protein ART_0446 [Arthrobacter sp. PAMC 25486]|uniref:TetR/AcrR family transcriptional regulator n=1 Tax=Arthrobacter sp. PAMC 25486 TaxID=1494608 RepID=UPI000535AF01|nr:TetR/AcrR family transcriptional regulator [Arthrobacter sp. PAMC 25486]AIY00045.1 hypothetical protein ART_0446 [Arthrobacter sp. PAMC 25486]